MPIEMRFLIDVVLVLIILGWANFYNYIQAYTKFLDKSLNDKSDPNP